MTTYIIPANITALRLAKLEAVHTHGPNWAEFITSRPVKYTEQDRFPHLDANGLLVFRLPDVEKAQPYEMVAIPHQDVIIS